MGPDITRKLLGISYRTFGDPRHVTIDTAHIIGQMNLIPVFRLLVVTVLTERSRGRLPGLAQLDNTFMGIMTNNTINDDVFTLKQLLILLMMPDETTLGIHGLNRSSPVTLSALFGIAIDPQFFSLGVRIMLTRGTVAALASNTRFRPGADHSRQTILMTFGIVARCMTRAAIVRPFFTRMIFCPAGIRSNNRVGEVILAEKVLVSS